MTGTTVQLARDTVGGNWAGAWAAAMVVASFFFGSVFGRAIIEAGSRIRLRRVASITLLLEAVLVFGVTWDGGGHLPLASAMQRELLLCGLAASMGLQTATLTGIGPLTVHTTFVTGMLNKLAQFVSRIAFRAYDFIRLGSADVETSLSQKNDKQEALFVFLIWSIYLGGAAAGSWLYQCWGLRTLYLGDMLLLSAIAIDQFHPLSLEEEKEQSES
jgi:uncharacterized membrane protein YoaK (UPF0700 family)